MGRLLYADRSDRPKLAFTGPQRAWFLHQVLTQAFEDIQPGESRVAAMITAHGRMTAYAEFVATDDAVLAHFEPELRASFPEEIRRYVFATRVEIEDVTDDYGLVLLVGEDAPSAAREQEVAAVQETVPLGEPALYLWCERADLDGLLARLRDAGATPASEDELERLRITNAIPRWGLDMDAKTFPQEAGIDSFAVHYDKGCYLGQEAMAKIHFRGKVNRALRVIRSDESLKPGTEIFEGEQKVGVVTSAANGLALAMLRHTVEPGSELTAGEARVEVER